MLSGIGPASILEKHNIPVVVNSPGVGANLYDHLAVLLRFKDKLGISLNYTQPYDLTSTLKLFKALAQYQLFGTGPLTTNVGCSHPHAFYLLLTQLRSERLSHSSERTIRNCSLAQSTIIKLKMPPLLQTHLISSSSFSLLWSEHGRHWKPGCTHIPS